MTVKHKAKTLQVYIFSVPSQIIEIGRIDYNQKLPSKDNPLIAPQREKTCLRGFANNKGADQPAHPRSLISSFGIRLW